MPFKAFGIVADIYFLLLDGNVPTLMCMKDLHRNGLDISIQSCKVICGDKEQNQKMENFSWCTTGSQKAGLSFYTEKELRTIDKSFGHPPVKTTDVSLRRTKGSKLDSETRQALQKIESDCGICKVHDPTPRSLN